MPNKTLNLELKIENFNCLEKMIGLEKRRDDCITDHESCAQWQIAHCS